MWCVYGYLFNCPMEVEGSIYHSHPFDSKQVYSQWEDKSHCSTKYVQYALLMIVCTNPLRKQWESLHNYLYAL